MVVMATDGQVEMGSAWACGGQREVGSGLRAQPSQIGFF
jgi:hypothetical protein